VRFGPFTIARAAAAAAKTLTPDAPRGASGTVNMDGFLQPEEYNPDLQWPASLKVWQRMLRSDGSVREAFLHTSSPVENATWEIEAASDDPDHLEHAEAVRQAWFEWPATPFETTNKLRLKYLGLGFQLFELVDKIVEAELDVEDPKTGDKTTLPRREFLTWDWEHRKPDTVVRWLTHRGRLTAVEQFAFDDVSKGFKNFTVPAEALEVLVCEQEGDDFTGTPVTRAAHKPWFMKEMIEKVAAASVELYGLGIKVAYVPESARNDTSMVDKIEELLANVKAGLSNHIVFPGPKGEASMTGPGGYWFEIQVPPGGLPDFTPLLEYQRGEIKGAVLARFAELGHGQTGARSTGDTQQQVWYDALHAVAAHICGVHNDLIKRWVDRNYAGVEKYPKLVARDIEARTLTEFADANAKLVSAGAIEADKPYRDFVRRGIDAPAEDPETDQRLRDQQDAAQFEPLNPKPGGDPKPGDQPPAPGKPDAPPNPTT
jgi:hypothetical protein